MMPKKTIFFAGVILCLLVAAAFGFYWYQKPRTGVEHATADFQLSAPEIFSAFQTDETTAGRKYSGKVIEVQGEVEGVERNGNSVSLLLSSGQVGGVNCSLSPEYNKASLPAKGSVVKVKGRCVGFLMDVNLVDAVIVDNQK